MARKLFRNTEASRSRAAFIPVIITVPGLKQNGERLRVIPLFAQRRLEQALKQQSRAVPLYSSQVNIDWVQINVSSRGDAGALKRWQNGEWSKLFTRRHDVWEVMFYPLHGSDINRSEPS
jgi:hypothetical protein